MNSFLEASKPFKAFGDKAQDFFAGRYPSMLENAIHGIHIGRNKDAAPTDRGGFRVSGSGAQIRGNYLETPDKILPIDAISNKDDAGRASFSTRVSDSAREYILEMKSRLMDGGATAEVAEKRVRDSISVIGHYDDKLRQYVAEPMVGKTKDSLLAGLAIPYWDVSYTTKVFKQPFIQGIARNLVDVIGVPNVWADMLVMYAETFEGMARLSGVAKSNGEFNDSAPVRSRMGQLVSEFVNLVVDYETSFHEGIVASQPGNFLTPMAITDRERYARLMLEQLTNALWLFGAPEAGFEGLAQLEAEDAYGGTPLNTIWNGSSATKGALAVTELLKMIGDMQEALSFLPSSVRINVSPTAYKVLKWTMQSDVYNPTNPLRIIKDNFKDSEMIVSNGFGTGIEDFKLVSDPFCAAHTPWNDNASDLMFITFPTIKSALDPQEGVVVAPVAIENFVLPSFPQRDGLQRTMLKRIGSLIAPITGTIKIVRGFGVQ
jgi:hypothetical protein